MVTGRKKGPDPSSIIAWWNHAASQKQSAQHKEWADDVSEKAKDARIRVSAALDRAKTTYADLQEHGIESARAAVKQADETIRSHPYESVGVAFGIGILIGAILRRR